MLIVIKIKQENHEFIQQQIIYIQVGFQYEEEEQILEHEHN